MQTTLLPIATAPVLAHRRPTPVADRFHLLQNLNQKFSQLVRYYGDHALWGYMPNREHGHRQW